MANSTADTEPAPPCHVLMRRPLSESRIRVFLTVTLETHARVLRTPRLPMLHVGHEPSYQRQQQREVRQKLWLLYLMPCP